MVELEGVFAASVAQLNSGTPLDACLAMYPAESAELSPLLRVVANLQKLAAPAPAMDPTAVEAARVRFVARASALSQPARSTLEDAFDQSAAMLAAGAALEQCLDRFPHHAAELRPMLETMAGLQQVPQPAPPPDPVARSMARGLFLARAAALSQPPNASIEDALQASLRMAAGGATVEECLQAYPHYASELRSALAITGALATQVAQPAPVRPAGDIAAQRQAFVSSASATRRAARTRPPNGGWLAALAGLFRQPAWARAAALLVVVLLTLGFSRVAVTAASDALPGDTLYPVKLAAEQARLLVTPDDSQRASLRAEFDQNRREEAAVVTELRRQVQVQFPGVIESMVDGHWRIVGLETPVLVPGDAVVRGQPAVGAHVIILAFSDGGGSLVARQVLVLAPADALPPTMTATSTPRIYQPVLAPERPTATWTPGLGLSPTRTPTASATVTATPTASATSTPSGSPTATPSITATPTATFPPRPKTIFGVIVEISPTWWQVGAYGLRITPDTVIDESQGAAVVGASVQVEAWEQANGSLEARLIQVQPGAVETDTFTGIIREMGGSQWFIGNRWVIVDGSTVISGAPAVGKSATVDVWRVAGGPWTASRIAVEASVEPVYIRGPIGAIGANSWVVDGVTVLITGDTVITGLPPQVGLWAEVTAGGSSGSPVALTITVVPVPSTATATPTASPPPTATPTATSPPTATPTATPDPPTATPTATPEPPTATLEPPTATPLPPTATPEPPTATPLPPTATPEPPTATPEPPTATPEPPAEPSTATPTSSAEPPEALPSVDALAATQVYFFATAPARTESIRRLAGQAENLAAP